MSMRKGGGKNKGTGYERRVAGFVDTWWEVAKNTFWRTVTSGGWKEAGDIAPRLRQGQAQVWWPFVMECKFYKRIDIQEVFSTKKGQLLIKWWVKLTEDVEKAVVEGRNRRECIRLLVFRQNRGADLVMFCRGEIGAFVGWSETTMDKEKRVEINLPGLPPLVIMRFDAFTRVYTKKVIYMEYCKNE